VLVLKPTTLKAANAAVKLWHRHHRPPQGGLFAVGVSKDGGDSLCGTCIVGRPVARMSDDGWTAEATRCATDGARNACSILYRAAWRATKALGYKRLITFSLPEEGGASLRAAGFKLLGECGGGNWSRSSRRRTDDHPTQVKLKWELSCD
jgi:hypothetical protein